jgi:uncharacterized protein (TIGR02001 family)
MKKVVLSVVAAMALATPALAADLKMLTKAPPPPPSPWDLAFGDAIMTDYMWRGITQSAHRGSVAVYFEPRYNFSDTLQGYIGLSGESIDFPNHAAAEIDFYGGFRPTFGKLALDFGAWLYYYPGGQCFSGNGIGPGNLGGNAACNTFNSGGQWQGQALPLNANQAKAWASFIEIYGKGTYTVTDSWSLGAQVYYSPNVSNSGANGTYVAGTIKYTAPAGMPLPKDVGWYASVDGGYWWLGTSDAFYGTGFGTPFANGVPYKSFANLDAGIGFTWKVFTLDFRYYWSGLNKADCNAFTSDHTARFSADFSPINPGGVGSNWCSQAVVVKLSSDLTFANLK